MFLDPFRIPYSKYFDYYEGRLDALFRVPGNAVNGLGFLQTPSTGNGVSTRFNFLSVLSRFYSAAVLADLPVANAATYKLIHQATEHWSVCGETLLIVQDGQVRTVRPDFVWPIRSEFDRETLDRILLVYPRRDTQAGDWENAVTTSSKAMVIDYEVETGRAWQSIRDYSPGVLGDGPRGQEVDVGKMVWIKSGEPPYVTVESTVREVCIRLNILQLALNSTSVPILQVEKDCLGDGQLKNQQPTLETVANITTNSPLGLTAKPPFAGEEGARYVERAGQGLSESIEFVRLLLGQLGVLSGVPDYVFGVQLGRPNDESERVLFAGQARVNAFQGALKDGLEQVGIKVDFNYDPFITSQKRIANVTAQLSAGIISQQEARLALGWPEAPTVGTLPTIEPPSRQSNVYASAA